MTSLQKSEIITKLGVFITLYCNIRHLPTRITERRDFQMVMIDFDKLNDFEKARLKILGNQDAYLAQYHPDYLFVVNIIIRLIRSDRELELLNWEPVTQQDLQKVNTFYNKLI